MQTIRVRTTQNVYIDYALASIGDRILAYLIDRVILILYTVALFAFFVQADVNNIWVWIILLGIPWLFYSLAFEITMNGQTPGKRVMNIQVIKLDGTPATVGSYLLRWIFALVDFYIMSGVIAVVCIAMGGRGQRVGDMVANTSVVKGGLQQEISGSDIFITPEETHTPTFAQVADLSDRDIEIIHRALEVMRQHDNDEPVLALTDKIKSRLGIQSDLGAVDFLNTIVKDYSIVMAGRV
ncbi:RDD family protein [Chryseolinea sp. T2]|uniref:RDD family protein n=1 Tax=Chryseolinea sp. T2 TaxID=3129255 RepID=UPI0030773C7F